MAISRCFNIHVQGREEKKKTPAQSVIIYNRLRPMLTWRSYALGFMDFLVFGSFSTFDIRMRFMATHQQALTLAEAATDRLLACDIFFTIASPPFSSLGVKGHGSNGLFNLIR